LESGQTLRTLEGRKEIPHLPKKIAWFVALSLQTGGRLLPASQTIENFCHTLTIVLIDHALLDKGDDSLWDWLAECWTHTNASRGRHSILAVPMEERLGDQFSQKRSALRTAGWKNSSNKCVSSAKSLCSAHGVRKRPRQKHPKPPLT
jgi:hypothetical protein